MNSSFDVACTSLLNTLRQVGCLASSTWGSFYVGSVAPACLFREQETEEEFSGEDTEADCLGVHPDDPCWDSTTNLMICKLPARWVRSQGRSTGSTGKKRHPQSLFGFSPPKKTTNTSKRASPPNFVGPPQRFGFPLQKKTNKDLQKSEPSKFCG